MAKLGARDVFMGQVRPGMESDTLDDWVGIYQSAARPGSRLTPGRSR
jgi:hypothetical protein